MLLSYQLHKVYEINITFDLLTWISIGIIYSPRTILPSNFKLLGQSILELTVAQGKGISTYRPTNRLTCAKQYAPPSWKGVGRKYQWECSRNTYVTSSSFDSDVTFKCDYQNVWQPDRWMQRKSNKVIPLSPLAKNREYKR